MMAWAVRLAEIAGLNVGWNGYAAPPPSPLAVKTAREYIFTRTDVTRVAPAAVGGVGVTVRRNGRKAYVEFLNDGKVFALFSDGESEPVSREVPPGPDGFTDLNAAIRDYLDSR